MYGAALALFAFCLLLPSSLFLFHFFLFFGVNILSSPYFSVQITTPRLSTPQELRSLNVEREGQRIASPVRRIPGRKRPWGEEEVANLIQGVEKYGVGAWCVIRDNVYLNFRSSVDIKDKWRNLVKTGEVNPADYTLVDRSVYSRSGSRTNTPQQKKKKKKTTTTTNTTREKVEMGQW
eukprot:m.237110 g.237110  ORF g.237110 m.237110 type:complete len:178 (+) comp22495_c1_seq2:1649-2182(+)